jgi:hypothetical protein
MRGRSDRACAELAAQQRLGFQLITKSACPALLDVSVHAKEQPVLTAACAAFMQARYGERRRAFL